MSRTNKSLDQAAKEYLESFRNQAVLGIGAGQIWGSATRFNKNGQYNPHHPRQTVNIWQAEGSFRHNNAPLIVNGSDGRQGVPGDRTGTKSLSSNPDDWKKPSVNFQFSPRPSQIRTWASLPLWLKNELLELAQRRQKKILEAESEYQTSVWEWIERSLYEKRFVENSQLEKEKEQEERKQFELANRKEHDEKVEREQAKRVLMRERLKEKRSLHKEKEKQEKFERKWPKIGEPETQPELSRRTKAFTKKPLAMEKSFSNQKVRQQLPGPQFLAKKKPTGNCSADQSSTDNPRPKSLSAPGKHSNEHLQSEHNSTNNILSKKRSDHQLVLNKRSNNVECRRPAHKKSTRFTSPSDRKSRSENSPAKASRFGKLFKNTRAKAGTPPSEDGSTGPNTIIKMDPNAVVFVPGGASWEAPGRK